MGLEYQLPWSREALGARERGPVTSGPRESRPRWREHPRQKPPRGRALHKRGPKALDTGLGPARRGRLGFLLCSALFSGTQTLPPRSSFGEPRACFLRPLPALTFCAPGPVTVGRPFSISGFSCVDTGRPAPSWALVVGSWSTGQAGRFMAGEEPGHSLASFFPGWPLGLSGSGQSWVGEEGMFLQRPDSAPGDKAHWPGNWLERGGTMETGSGVFQHCR